jgi:hypothetical protein
MKTITRIVIILAAAAVIAGLVLAVGNVTGVQAAQGTGQGQPHGSTGVGQGGIRPVHGNSAGGSFSMAEIIKNLAIVAVITAGVTGIERLLTKLRMNRLVHQPVSRAQPGRKE